MKGQWLGQYSGSNEGLIIIDLDDLGDTYKGHAFLFDNNNALPSSLVRLEGLSTSVNTYSFPVTPLNVNVLGPTSHDALAELRPDVIFPKTASVRIEQVGAQLSVSWITDIGTGGSTSLEPSAADKPSILQPRQDIQNWKQFKEFATTLDANRYIFRGQDITKRLRTTFHRERRKDLIQYINEDIPYAHRILSALTRHLFDLNDAKQNAAFWNLLQHHGYPTPLLDWTHSPFVAAFFAYRHNRYKEDLDGKIRIFLFDRLGWVRDFPQLQHVTMVPPHFSILEALTIENNRALPQQALSSVTNLDDIETYIQLREAEKNKSYLQVIDLPRSERRTVMQELSLMGITAGSLFPGLDGACEELRGRFFHPLK
jgi:hypothetical protein